MNNYIIKPLRSNIIIEPFNVESEVGLVFTDTDRLEKATVKSVGNNVVEVSPGDVILYKNYSTDTIKDGESEYVLIDESEVKAILCTTATIEY